MDCGNRLAKDGGYWAIPFPFKGRKGGDYMSYTEGYDGSLLDKRYVGHLQSYCQD